MLIQKDERLSRATPSQHSDWDAGRRRAPRNWFKIVRSALYVLIGLLAGIAALAAVALFLDSGAPPLSPPTPSASADAGATPPSSDALAGTSAPTPAIPPPAAPDLAPDLARPSPAPVPPPAAAAPPPRAATAEPDADAVAALQQQLHDATSALSGLRSETEALRKALSDTRQRQTAETAPRPAATPSQAPPARPAAAPAPAPAPASSPASADTGSAWADAERTIRALSRHPAPDTAAPPAAAPPAAAPPAAAPPAAAAPAPPPAAAPAPATELAANAPLPAPASAAPRPRVFLHYPAGSPGGMHEATDIAQRLLFSDFAYADTRSTVKPTSDSVIRYFYPEDAQAAERLAALLSDNGPTFRVQDASDRRGHIKSGTLDVWIGR